LESLRQCIRLDFEIGRSLERKRVSGKLVIHNDCGSPISILIDPVQVYYRRSKSEFFVPETIVDPAYAVLYVFRRDLGIGPDSFLGDGGLEAFGMPEYALIPARSVKELPFMDKEGVLRNLSPGEYGIVFATSVVWGASRNERNNPQIDLGLSVNRFNQGDKSRRKGSRQDGERVSSSPVFVAEEP
jgi:hypothetical protein